jgi:DMSO reductase family type II enzyme heme b subunit
MKIPVDLLAAPTGMQPGGYVGKAYAGRDVARTPHAELEVAHPPGVWRLRVSWPCPEPVVDTRRDPSLFPDALALFAPVAEASPWVTMGAPGLGVEGVLWRADSEALIAVAAEGLGTMQRRPAPSGWRFDAKHASGAWQVELTLAGWSTLDAAGRLALAVWRGADRERGGLKSVSPGWLEVG